jgi:hypothetical protein
LSKKVWCPTRIRLDSNWRNTGEPVCKRLGRSTKLRWRNLAKYRRNNASGRYQRPMGSAAVRNALVEESAARQEYMRALRVFTDLTIYHKVPEER